LAVKNGADDTDPCEEMNIFRQRRAAASVYYLSREYSSLWDWTLLGMAAPGKNRREKPLLEKSKLVWLNSRIDLLANPLWADDLIEDWTLRCVFGDKKAAEASLEEATKDGVSILR
jgi:hypothetical protein